LERHVPDVDQAQAGGQGHDQQREQQAHAEHGDDDADGQEQFLPERVPVAQDGGIDHRVIEGQRHFKHAQHRGDPQRLQQPGGPAMVKPPPCRQRQQDHRDHEGQLEMLHRFPLLSEIPHRTAY
jgi:hypothetical protein